VWEFFAIRDEEPSGGPTKPARAIRVRPDWAAAAIVIEERPAEVPEYRWPSIAEGVEIRFLIATVPDPIDTPFGYLFDQYVEALQRAAEAADYVIDRRWLPWPGQHRGRAARAEPGRLPPHHRQPGLLLFRRSKLGEARQLLAVCLVGETPTDGIHKIAFWNSLRLIWECPEPRHALGKGPAAWPTPRAHSAVDAWSTLAQAQCRPCLAAGPTPWLLGVAEGVIRAGPPGFYRPDGDLVRVIGPSFSGSAPSLRQALVEAKKGHTPPPDKRLRRVEDPPLFVVSGAATGFNRPEFCQGWAKPDIPRTDTSPQGFCATALPDDQVRRWVYKYLHNPTDPVHGEQPDRIAILREANTGYGAGVAVDPDPEDANHVWDLPFPLHISQVRYNYTREQLARLESLGMPRSSRLLPFPRDEEADLETDVLPVQAPPLTAALNDMILSNILTIIAKHRIRYVGIVATDTRDRIFLANLVRDRCPDVQLFMTVPELLLAHPDYSYALRGTVIGSTYPLHLGMRHRIEDPPRAPGLLFASQSTQGYYNAALVHLDKTERMIDYGESDLSAPYHDRCRPGVWISVVGQNGRMIPLYHAGPSILETTYRRERAKYSERADSLKKEFDLYNVFTFTRPTELAKPAQTPQREWPPLLYPVFWLALFAVVAWSGLRYLSGCYAWLCPAPDVGAAPNPAVHREHIRAQVRRNAAKQRIDFLLAALAMILFCLLIAQLSVTPVRVLKARDFSTGFFPALIVLLFPAACWAVVVWIAVMAWKVYRHDRGSERSAQRLALFLEPRRLRLAFRLCARPGFWRSVRDWLARISSGRLWRLLFPEWWLLQTERMLALAVTVALAGGAFFFIRGLVGDMALTEVLAFDRTMDLANGVSPVVPAFFLCAALFAWGVFFLRKFYLLRAFRVGCPFPSHGRSEFTRLWRLDREIRSELMPPSTFRLHPWTCLGLGLILLLMTVRLLDGAIPTPEGFAFDRLAQVGFFLASFFLLFTLCQFHFAWGAVRKLLRTLARLPMASAFDRLPETIRSIWGGSLFSTRPRHAHLAIAAHQLQRIHRLLTGRLPGGDGSLARAGGLECVTILGAAREVFDDPRLPPPSGLAPGPVEDSDQDPGLCPTTADRPESEAMTDYSRRCAAALLSCWPAHSLEEAFESHQDHDGRKEVLASFFAVLPPDHPVREWVRLVEDFLAIEVVRYVSQFFAHLRNLMVALTVGSLLLVLAATLYPFHPQSLLVLCLFGLTGTVAVSMIVWLVQINRDELVSRIERSSPNRFTPDLAFIQGTAAYVLPIVGVLLVQFPSVGSSVRAVLEPLTHITH
jgi:hypothetical protein